MSDDELGYGEAVAELEGILAELEVDDADVDVLAERVRRAGELIALCRRRIEAARFEVEQVVAALDPAGAATPGAPADGDDPDGPDEAAGSDG